MADIYRGNPNNYKAEIICNAIKEMNNDEYNLTRLKNDKGKAINIEMNLMEIIYGYYKGKVICVGE